MISTTNTTDTATTTASTTDRAYRTTTITSNTATTKIQPLLLHLLRVRLRHLLVRLFLMLLLLA